jgi:hypothetical protein
MFFQIIHPSSAVLYNISSSSSIKDPLVYFSSAPKILVWETFGPL